MVDKQLELFSLPLRRVPSCSWVRVVVLDRMCEEYSIWERWITHELAWFRRAVHSPYMTAAQSRQMALMYFFHFELAVKDWFEGMAKNGTKKDTIAISRWVNLRLTDEDKTTLLSDIPLLEDVVNSFGALVFAGYRLSVSWDSYSQAIQASLVCVDPESVNAGIGVSARHPDIDMAIITLWYKVQMMGDQPWSDFVSPTPASNWG